MTEPIEIPIVQIKPEAWRRLRNGHRWVFANELDFPVAELPVGGVIQILASDGKHFCFAHANPRTLIAARILSYSTNPPAREWLFARLDAAYRMREQLELGQVYRLVFAEADSLPGLIVDRYGEHFVIQVLTAGMELWRQHLVDWLRKQFHPQSIFFRNDSSYRIQEGLSPENESLLGEPPERFRWETDGIVQIADLKSGQKTGAFLDQRMNRSVLDPFITTSSIVLDLFSHVGGFGIRAAKRGARKVVLVDSSESALALAKEIAVANDVADRSEFIHADIMEWLPEHRPHYDLIVCDPPALIKNRAALANGLRAYTSLNRRAMHHLKREGVLLTFSCSQLLQRPMFLQMLRDAARNDPLQIHSELKQSPDHPILLSHPETEYLKGAILLRRALP